MPKSSFQKMLSKLFLTDFVSKIETSILNYLANAGERDIPQIEDLNLLS